VGGSRWVGGKSFKSKKRKKKKPGVGRGENKVPKKNRDQGKKETGKGAGRNKVAKKKLRSGLIKGKRKTSTWDGTGIEKRILSVHHPSTLVHWCGSGSLWPWSPSCIHKLQVNSTTPEVKPADGHLSHCENA